MWPNAWPPASVAELGLRLIEGDEMAASYLKGKTRKLALLPVKGSKKKEVETICCNLDTWNTEYQTELIDSHKRYNCNLLVVVHALQSLYIKKK